MFLIDNLLGAPMNGLMFVFRKINDAVHEEMALDERALMSELTALHRALDEGAISEAEFEPREHALLERLDRLHGEQAENDSNSATS